MDKVYNHKKNMDNFINSITRYFGVDQDLSSLSRLNDFLEEENYKNLIVLSYDSLTLEKFQKELASDSFLKEHYFFSLTVPRTSLDCLMHSSLLEKINDISGAHAYGVFPFGNGAYKNLEEANRRIINLSLGDGKRLIYVSFKGYYGDDIVKIDADCFKLCEQLDNSAILILSESTDEDMKVPLCVVKRMSSSEKIRLVVMKDLKTINALISSSWQRRINIRPDIFEVRRFITEGEFYNYCNRASGENCYVYEVSEQIVGFILFRINFVNNERYLKNRSYLNIENIYVKEEYRRRGIGTKLYNEVCNYGRKLKIKKIEFSVLNGEEDILGFIKSLKLSELSMVYEKNLFDVK
ncbi:MAG: GNAT family N-acetyltransferase [bacterium]|nr:GNAT family N-acetyltransferase [bacterium]